MSRSGEGSTPTQAPQPPGRARRGATPWRFPEDRAATERDAARPEGARTTEGRSGQEKSGRSPAPPSTSGSTPGAAPGAISAASRTMARGPMRPVARHAADPAPGPERTEPHPDAGRIPGCDPAGAAPSGAAATCEATAHRRAAGARTRPEGRQASGLPGAGPGVGRSRGGGVQGVGSGEATAPSGVRKGRGAASNRSGRFERFAYDACDDGWESADDTTGLETILTRERARSIINEIESPDLGFERTINPYRGCEHGCIYCYARPAHAYVGLSPGLDFESQIFFKPDAPRLLEKALGRQGYQPRLIVIGANTDAYQPTERRLRITRALLETAWRFRQPIAVVTKSALVIRDLDLLSQMAQLNLAKIAVSVTTLESRLARIMEPRAATPRRRIETIRALAEAGIPVTVMMAPVIPALNDHEIEAILETSAAAGASRAGYVALRLPLEIKDLFREWLEAHAPDRARRVLRLVREMRGGRDYDPDWSTRMTGQGGYARLIRLRFNQASERLGLTGPPHPSDIKQFRAPSGETRQLDLFST